MNEDANNSTAAMWPKLPAIAALQRRSAGERKFATILQVLPALGAGGGVERGTIEIAQAIVAAGGRALVASSGGARAHEVKRVGAEHVE
ncbi:MAG: hypothetical protein ACREB6_11490, partial [Rhodospirillales bacterium]